MVGQSAAAPTFRPGSVAEVAWHLISSALALLLLAAFLAALAASDRGAAVSPVASRPEAPAHSMQLAVVEVLDAAAAADDPTAGDAASSLEDTWGTLAVVLGRFEAQQSVAQGHRPPLMAARPPAPGDAARDDALVRSAAGYVRGALETRDLFLLQRARDLLEMRSP